MPSDQPIPLFVYGTLMPGEANHHLIERYVRRVRFGTIEGMLVDLGAYPALVPGDGLVRGVLLDLDGEALAVTDRLEGYHAGREGSLFLRHEVMVRLDEGEQVEAWVYEYADFTSIRPRSTLILAEKDGRIIYGWRR